MTARRPAAVTIRRTLGIVTLLSLAPGAVPARAEQQPIATTAARPAAESSQLSESVAAALDEIRRLLAEQQRLIESQGQEIAELKRRLAETSTLTAALRGEVADLGKQPQPLPSTTLEERLAQVEQSVQRVPEMPAEVVSAGEFPGSLRIPGTDSAFKIGGQARTILVKNLAALGTDDRFVTSSIPIAGTPEAGKGARTTSGPLSKATSQARATPCDCVTRSCRAAAGWSVRAGRHSPIPRPNRSAWISRA